MEARLLEYRAKKKREAQIAEAKEKITNIFSFKSNNSNEIIKESKIGDRVLLMNPTPPSPPPPKPILTPTSDIEDDDGFVEDISLINILKNHPWAVTGFMIWTTLFLIFISIQWGAVFFVISALIFVCANTRTGARRIGEMSAYSVFNRNCRNIEGAMTAEQFERELRYGPVGMM